MVEEYSHFSKQELIGKIQKLESRKKYGLIWDEEKVKEHFEKESENALPVLKLVKAKELKTDPAKPTNFFIEGDNYHALSVLNYTHQGRIDVIYIDPPYNTGARDWKYNNNYVDNKDTYRHSKWLSMMKKRLLLAKKLLRDEGTLIIAIDDNELAHLLMLAESIFPQRDVTSVTIVHNPRGNITKNFAQSHEYALFLITKGKSVITRTMKENTAPRKLRRWGHNSKRTDRPTMFYPIYVKDQAVTKIGKIPDDNFNPNSKNIKKSRGVIEVWPIDDKGIERRWNFSLDTIEEHLDRIVVVKKEDEVDLFLSSESTVPKTVWSGGEYDAGGKYGSKLVEALTAKKFPFPKSLYNVYKCIEVTTRNNPNAIILDFFAGSGTTGHAVALLNKEDDGNRQFILCTNDENGIATEVCYPRVKAVIKGHKDYPDITGIKSNLKYLKTAFVKNSYSRDDLKMRITRECTEMLCLREGIFDEVKSKHDYKIFEQNNKIMVVYYALEREGLQPLKKQLDKMHGEKLLYCFTLDPLGLNKQDFVDWSDVSLEAIPQPILDVYKEIYDL